MKKQLLLSLVLLATFTLPSFGQSDSSKTTVVFFGDGSSTASSNSKKEYHASALKLGIFNLVSGMYGLNYEHELSDLFTIEAGAGLTGRNWVYGLASGEDGLGSKPQTSKNFDTNMDVYDEDYLYESRESKIGFFLTASPKFYYSDEDGMDGSYLAFNLQYRKYNYLAYGTISSPNDQNSLISGDKDIKEFEKQTILALRWGYQSMNDKTILDYFVGIGIRNYSGERRDLGNIMDVSGSNLLIVSDKPRETKGSKFFFEVGFNVGLWWDKKK